MKYNKKNYEIPSTEVYKGDKSIHKIIQLINESTDSEISKTFSSWIDDNIKKCMDVADLSCIKKDIDKYSESLNYDNLPELDWYTVIQGLIDLFINTIEEKIGNRLNYDDFLSIPWICDFINIIQPNREYKKKVNKKQKFNDIWFRNIITAIRNWLMHNRYLTKRDSIYIHSKNAYKKKMAKKDIDWNYIVQEETFEATISPVFFWKIIEFCLTADRKFKTTGIVMDNINRNTWFDKNKDLIRIETQESIKKWEISESSRKKIQSIEDWDKWVKSRNLSKWQKVFLSEYFRTHEFNRKNLEFVNKFMVYDDNRIQLNTLCQNNEASLLDQRNFFIDLAGDNNISKWMMQWFTDWDDINKWKIWWTDEDIEKEINKKLERLMAIPGEIFSIYKNIEAKRYLWSNKLITLEEILPLKIKKSLVWLTKALKYDLLVSKDLHSTSIKWEYRKVYLKALFLSKFYVNNPKLELAQPQKRVGNRLRKQWRDYIMNRCKNNPDFYWSKDAKEKQINTFVEDDYRKIVFQNLTRWSLDNWIIRNIDDVEKIENNIVFCTRKSKDLSLNNKKILKENVVNIVKKRKEKLDTVTLISEEEHIRNAFAHHHYTILPWFNKILLWDPSIDDTSNWEKVYDLDALYQNALNRVNEDYLDKNVEA